MRWPYSIRNKTTAIAALAAVFFLVGFNNIYERGHINDLEKSISSIYADRLMVESYILQLNHAIDHKQKIVVERQGSASAADIAAYNLKIDSLLAAYEVTYLTPEEAAEFEVLKQLLTEIKLSEQSLLNNTWVENRTETNELAKLNDLCIASLVKLSAIQTKEGLHLKEESSAIVKASNISSKFEMALLIIMALVLQAVILSAKPIFAQSQKTSLN